MRSGASGAACLDASFAVSAMRARECRLYSALSIIAPSVNVLRRTRRKPSTIRGAAPDVVIGQSTAARAGAHPSYGGCQAWIVGAAIISFFLCDGVAIFSGDAQSAHLAQCSATQASGPTRISRRSLPCKAPSNPNRATRSGVEEKNGISAEGRAKRVMPDFFFHSATRCATRATFQDQAKGDSFFKRSTAPL